MPTSAPRSEFASPAPKPASSHRNRRHHHHTTVDVEDPDGAVPSPHGVANTIIPSVPFKSHHVQVMRLVAAVVPAAAPVPDHAAVDSGQCEVEHQE